MPLLMCPNDNASMQTLERNGVQFDMCPNCRGVWLDRGELEKLMETATQEGRSSVAQSSAPAPQPYRAPQETQYRDDRHKDERYHSDEYRYKKKKRDSIFDIFDFD